MKQVITGIAVALLAGTACANGDAMPQSPLYKECIGLATANPQQALAKAEEWLKSENNVAANHCRAMALYGLRQYAEAAEALEDVRALIPQENTELRSFVTKQAATAWQGSGNIDRAQGILATQLQEMDKTRGNNVAVARQTSGLLLERARLNNMFGNPKLALADLDRAISLTPLDADLLAERGASFLMLGDYPLAQADAKAALTLKPTHTNAKKLLAQTQAAPQQQ